MSKIYFFTPFTPDKDLGKHYNELMSLVPNDEDYVCFTDADSMFTTHNFGNQLQDIIKKYPECPLFTCVTNRVGTQYQCVEGAWDEEQIKDHWQIGKKLQESNYDECVDVTKNTPISGVLMLLRKREWKECGGFQEGIGMLGVDNSIHYRIKDLGKKIYVMTGVYVMHYYRNKSNDKSHLI